MNVWTAGDSGTDTANYDGTVTAAAERLKIAPELFQMAELDCLYDTDARALWTFMNPAGRPNFTLPMLQDFRNWQQGIVSSFGPDKLPLDFLVLGSRFPKVFCYGGDLDLFVACIREGDRNALIDYGRQCVRILHNNFVSLNLPVVTIGLVEGDALGGGFEALLSFDMIVAERGSKFGLPESMFGLFPGMGAHSFLSRKLGSAMADRMIMGGETYIAEQLFEMGLVHSLFDAGQGRQAVEKLMKRERRRFDGRLGANLAMARAEDLSLQELEDIVDFWADSALKLSEHNIRLMQRLVSAQSKLSQKSSDEVISGCQAKAFDAVSEKIGLPEETKCRA